MDILKGYPFLELYPPYLASLNTLLTLNRLDMRIFVWLKNVFDGLIVAEEHGYLVKYLTPSSLFLVDKDKYHATPRFLMGVPFAPPADYKPSDA